MIRSRDLLAGMAPDALRALGKTWKAAAEVDAIDGAMRSATAATVIRRACASPAMVEDSLLLLANPFDTVEEDEVVTPEPFLEIGLLARRDDGSFDVNVDMALAAVPKAPLEFGFAATLLVRLAAGERAVVARSMEIGARPTVTDTALDTAAAYADPSRLTQVVARLTAEDRAVIEEALALGDLPEDTEAMRLDARAPTVSLDPGAAGQRGLVFRVSVPAAGVSKRPVVPLDIAEELPAILEQVPPPPPTTAAKRRTKSGGSRRTKSGSSRRTSGAVDTVAQSGASRPVRDDLRESGVATRLRSGGYSAAQSGGHDPLAGSGAFRRDPMAGSGAFRRDPMSGSGAFRRDPLAGSGAFRRDPLAGSGPNSPFRLGRVTAIEAAGGLVDLDTRKIAEAAVADAELSSGILRVVGDSMVVLRADVDPKEWAELCALRLGL